MARMTAPPSGVKIRMYRQGHGDCFLLAMRSSAEENDEPVYMLIDCGLKRGSEVKEGLTIDKIIADIAEATGNRLDIVLVTHEHEDHVNGFLKRVSRRGPRSFDSIEIGEVWLAWTEDGDDDFANALRERFNDTLVGLIGMYNALGVDTSEEKRAFLRELLEFEAGDEEDDSSQFGKAVMQHIQKTREQHPHFSQQALNNLAITGITNKRAIKYLRDKAKKQPPLFLRPDKGPYSIPGVDGLQVFSLGPPRNEALLLSLDPIGEEGFEFMGNPPTPGAFAIDGATHSLFKSFFEAEKEELKGPFHPRYHIPENQVFGAEPSTTDKEVPQEIKHYQSHYGKRDPENDPYPWRQINSEWLQDAEKLALRLNDEVNNTSLVFAIELPASKKVLLFTGDAQRGSWISWSDLSWDTDDCSSMTARDLLSRVVFYKVGHHGSHNATLNGTADSDKANLSWFAQGDFRSDFVAMIPANTAWATNKSRPWEHPLESIEHALKEKARGKVFRMDIDNVSKPDDVPESEWQQFEALVEETDFYLEYTVLDE